jgi:hypothetical protein
MSEKRRSLISAEKINSVWLRAAKDICRSCGFPICLPELDSCTKGSFSSDAQSPLRNPENRRKNEVSVFSHFDL